MICYDCTDQQSFTQAVALYKELLKDPEGGTKVSRFAKLPIAFVGLKLDLTDYINAA